MSPEDWLSAEMRGEIVALVHSHPGGLPTLREAERQLHGCRVICRGGVCRGAIHKFRCVPHLAGQRRFERGGNGLLHAVPDAAGLAIEMPDFWSRG